MLFCNITKPTKPQLVLKFHLTFINISLSPYLMVFIVFCFHLFIISLSLITLSTSILSAVVTSPFVIFSSCFIFLRLLKLFAKKRKTKEEKRLYTVGCKLWSNETVFWWRFFMFSRFFFQDYFKTSSTLKMIYVM